MSEVGVEYLGEGGWSTWGRRAGSEYILDVAVRGSTLTPLS